MALIQINDVASVKKQKEEAIEDSAAIGIDLGTSNSVISYFDGESLQIIADSFGELIPSAVYYDEEKILVGKKALNKAGVFRSIKRFMGKSSIDNSLYNYKQENGEILFKNQQNSYVSAEEISAEILKYLKITAEKHLDKKVDSAVITVPAYFDETQRIATKKAAHMAGLKVLRLINEPTAAALAYGLDKVDEVDFQGIYLVYDLGGGTFDISVLSLTSGIFKVLATLGDTLLGGDDIDNILVEEICASLDIFLTAKDKPYFFNIAKEIKEELSIKNSVNKKIIFQGKDYNFTINRNAFEVKIKPLVEKTLSMCESAIRDSKINTLDIKGIILVGGSSRIPYIKNSLKELFKVEPICQLNPDLVVSMGAGYKAAELSGKTKNSLLLDVLPLSLGIEMAGGIVEKIIHRNTLIPITKKQEFTTQKDNQTAMSFHILQGEREMAKDLRSLGKFSLKGIPPMAAGNARIMVSFSIDADGLLSVSAVEEKTGISQSIEIKPDWGLNFDAMRNMLEESLEHAEEDMQQRLLQQSKVEAQLLIDAAVSAIKEDGELLSIKQQQEISLALEQLLNAVNGNNREKIEENIKKLDANTAEFAAIRMNKKINQALSGKALTDIEDKLS
ncbi:MAG: Fe-S protein assembly chaperone HscA [Alphaproteobacteria bacterium]|nr:Fe-S protein assembly chaperone HscA [Alphaproteobacteria bacterium]